MELRVWFDGTQRVVCGVKLTTTCQEIVFALAHATQQAGRFTMIERWRNNERLLSPNEQPLVTLQRWGDHMNEVEFILRKTSTDLPANPLQSQQNSTQQPQPLRSNNASDPTQQVANGRRESPCNPLPSASSHQLLNEPPFDNVYQNHQYNLNRRPQTVLGPLTSSNSSIGFGSNYGLAHSQTLNNSFRHSISASTLPNSTNNLTASPSGSASALRPFYTDDQMINANSPSMLRRPHNGYQIHKDIQQQPKTTNQSQTEQAQVSKNIPIEDLYSTINKKRTNQPPAVPAKPRVVGPITPVVSLPMSHQQLQPVNNAQMNFYHTNHSPLSMLQNNFRPRHPPGYLDYLEAMASRNPQSQPLLANSSYVPQSQTTQSNVFQRTIDPLQMYSFHRNCSSPINNMSPNRYNYLGPINRINFEPPGHQNVNPIRHKPLDSGSIMNRNSTVNVKLHSAKDRQENSIEASSSVSQIGHDMLKVIEEQKKVLINQKNELDRLDNDKEYWENKQNTESIEMVNRIENEIRQLEELWKENQTQICKLEEQDFEKELRDLKFEQTKIQLEIGKQKRKLARCESEIAMCKSKIEQLESDLLLQDSDSETYTSSDDEQEKLYLGLVDSSNISTVVKPENDDFKPVHVECHTNGSAHNGHELNKETKSSEDEDYEDDSGGDASDDPKLPSSDNKPRCAKDVAYVDKRGLISGIRSLKLEKSRSLQTTRQIEPIRPESVTTNATTTSSINSKEKLSSNSKVDNRCSETDNQYPEKTANNKYEFLMTL